MSENRRLGALPLWVGRILLTAFGVVLWLWLYELVTGLVLAEEELDWVLDLIYKLAGSVLFGGIFFFTAPPILYGVMALYRMIERSLAQYTPKQIVWAIIGLFLGLLIVLIINLIFTGIPLPVTILLCVVFGFIGTALGARRMSEAIATEPTQSIAARTGSINLLDSSAIIDGRILDIARTGFVDGTFIIPAFILDEIRHITDNTDVLKRNRGKRGLDIINALQKSEGLDVQLTDDNFNEGDTDHKLLKLAEIKLARIITTDYNLNKIAALKEIKVLNINELANAIKPTALPGEKMTVKLVKEGKEQGQAVAFLADGTMIVVENGGSKIGEEVEVNITTSLQTAAGRMIFARI